MTVICHVTPTIQDGIVVRWNPDARYDHLWEVSASRNGVLVTGWSLIANEQAKAQFEQAVAFAWQAYQWLAASYAASFRGPSCDDVTRWLLEKRVPVLSVHLGESLEEAVKREAKERAT